MENHEKLRTWCERVVNDPTLASILVDGSYRTYCNVGTQIVCEAMGVNFFPKDTLANDMHDMMLKSNKWAGCVGTVAHIHANVGEIAIASRKKEGHGHITIVYPSQLMADSPSLKKLVPWVVNVGAVPPSKNAIVPTSQAFSIKEGEPSYFIYVG